MEKENKNHYLRIIFWIVVSFLIASVYEMFWAWVFAGSCCAVNPVYDMPNVFILAMLLSSHHLIRQTFGRRPSRSLGLGLKLLIVVLLVIIPVKKYLGVNDNQILLHLYFIYTIFFGLGFALIHKALQKLPQWKGRFIFKLWFGWLLTAGIFFLIRSNLIFTPWGAGFELGILAFQIWLLYKFVRLVQMTDQSEPSHL